MSSMGVPADIAGGGLEEAASGGVVVEDGGDGLDKLVVNAAQG